ncbi:MAG TPA: 6-phosphogluconolactonase [Chthonomonadaceae bacterium]|nr:6-phosphogluconolactonase [Chthonomonadaceae bacterium]
MPADTRAESIIFPDAHAIARDAAHRFVSLSAAAARAGRRFSAALAGGRTPEELYRLLASDLFRGAVEWRSVHLFFGDERCVPVDSPYSNFRMANEAMLKPLGLPASNIHRIEGERPDTDAAASAYEKDISQFFGATGTPRFDLVLLGMGGDGHTASLFPGTAALSATDRWVVRNEPGLEPFVPRITLTLPVLNGAANVLFLVAGQDKAQTVARVLAGPDAPTELPSQSVRPASGTLTWMLDRAAASALTA